MLRHTEPKVRRKKRWMLIGGTLAGALVLCLLLAGAVAGAVLYMLGRSDAAETAREFLRRNEKLRADIGEVRDFGWLVTGSLRPLGTDGNATLTLKVVGARRSADATVSLVYRDGYQWRVAGAAYYDDAGRVVNLLDAYAAPSDERAAGEVETNEVETDKTGETGEGEVDEGAAASGEREADEIKADDRAAKSPTGK